MTLDYFDTTDTLYINLKDVASVKSEEVADGFVLDYDAAGKVVGLEIEDASRRVQLERLVLNHLPGAVERTG